MLYRLRLSADLLTPLAAYLALRSLGASILLESVDQAERVGRHSFVLIPSREGVVLRGRADGWVDAIRRLAGPPLVDADVVLDESCRGERVVLPVGVGCAGYVGFEAAHALEHTVPSPMHDTRGIATVDVRRCTAAVVFDHVHQIAEVQVLCDSHADARARVAAIAEALQNVHVPPRDAPLAGVAECEQTGEEFAARVRDVQRRIGEGDLYQLVLSQRIRVSSPPSPLSAYRRLRRLNPSPYGILLEWEDVSLVAASPEMLVRGAGRQVETMPIAGTVPRGDSDAEDQERYARLRCDVKEVAEHQMLVDLARNDIGRVAVPGGVKVDQPLAMQRTSHVLHLTTTVRGHLESRYDVLDAFASCFPAGTVSGAPKVRALQRISEYEGETRGPYGGALLRLAADGTLDSALLLRTIVYTADVAWLQAGAGIVRRSNPELEYAETLHKLAAPAAALGIRLAGVLARAEVGV